MQFGREDFFSGYTAGIHPRLPLESIPSYRWNRPQVTAGIHSQVTAEIHPKLLLESTPSYRWNQPQVTAGIHPKFPLESITSYRCNPPQVTAGMYPKLPLESIPSYRWNPSQVTAAIYPKLPLKSTPNKLPLETSLLWMSACRVSFEERTITWILIPLGRLTIDAWCIRWVKRRSDCRMETRWHAVEWMEDWIGWNRFGVTFGTRSLLPNLRKDNAGDGLIRGLCGRLHRGDSRLLIFEVWPVETVQSCRR